MKITVPTDILELCKFYEKNGHQFYMVGGCVRDALLNQPSKDIDIATSATLEESIFLLKNLNIITDIQKTGEHFPVIRIKTVYQNEYEIATFRKDEGFGKTTTFKLASLEEDAFRRDLTINAIYYHPLTTEIVDPTNGYEDLKNGLIKFVGDPKQRIQEDRLRVLRAFRMANRFNFSYDKITENYLLNADLVSNKLKSEDRIAYERIIEEFFKAEKQCDLRRYFRQLLEFSILDNIFEGTNIRQIYLSNHTNVMNFLAQIFQFTDVNILKEKFKTWHFKNEMSNKILTLIKLQSFETIDYFKAKKMLKSSNLKRIEVLAHFKNFKNIKDVMALYDYEAVYTGEILKNMGYSQGLDMGLKMAELETASFLRFSETYFPN